LDRQFDPTSCALGRRTFQPIGTSTLGPLCVALRRVNVSSTMTSATTVEAEIGALEERLRQAELGPDPDFFAEALDDDAVLVSETGEPFFAKAKVVEAHRPGTGPKFKRVEMSNMKIVDHGDAAVVTCLGTYEAETTMTLKFMRVWAKKGGRWKIIAGSVAR